MESRPAEVNKVINGKWDKVRIKMTPGKPYIVIAGGWMDNKLIKDLLINPLCPSRRIQLIACIWGGINKGNKYR